MSVVGRPTSKKLAMWEAQFFSIFAKQLTYSILLDSESGWCCKIIIRDANTDSDFYILVGYGVCVRENAFGSGSRVHYRKWELRFSRGNLQRAGSLFRRKRQETSNGIDRTHSGDIKPYVVGIQEGFIGKDRAVLQKQQRQPAATKPTHSTTWTPSGIRLAALSSNS